MARNYFKGVQQIAGDSTRARAGMLAINFESPALALFRGEMR